MTLVGNTWDEILKEEYQKDYFKKIYNEIVYKCEITL